MKRKLLCVFAICLCLIMSFVLVACGNNGGSGGGVGGGSGDGSNTGEGSDPSGNTEITSIFSGYNLPQNCKLVWDEPSDWRKTVVKIGNDCVYRDEHLTSGYSTAYYYKKTETGYTVYLDEGDGQGYSYNTTFTYQQAADEFQIEIGNKYFQPSMTISRPSDPDTLTVMSGTFSTKKYSAMETYYWVMSDYDILCKSDAYGITELTVFDTSVTSFENAGVVLNVE